MTNELRTAHSELLRVKIRFTSSQPITPRTQNLGLRSLLAHDKLIIQISHSFRQRDTGRTRLLHDASNAALDITVYY
jgi:hypothetical protein